MPHTTQALPAASNSAVPDMPSVCAPDPSTHVSDALEIDVALHEIRNPLTLICSTLQLIESQHPEVADFKYWNELAEDLRYTRLLLQDLSSYNRGSALCLQTLHGRDFFRSAALSFAASLTDTPVAFRSRISPSLPDFCGDGVRLKQALFNLFTNARDALADTPHPRISFEVSATEEQLLLRLRDNGCGIPCEQLPHIFEPFVTCKQNGTGLGLAIAKQIIDAHGGAITAASTPGLGTIFTAVLPIQTSSENKP